ncbi:hypothetical protein [Desulfovibrio gilichinskyi]|uniref:Uncharacterized protein n=1 Tax=Desulfovibrio gilichinskyi TaxID=1519643 RepID=A0A1X7DJL1_9BACT|nr:hypothetical protein [Desulfovibrio gilichinskyi]SMF16833.1 hypothetical protein SAMN06295933_1996 [Desulfovibrio gilichinskyi]
MYKKTLIFGLIISGILFAGSALAGTKFINKDTAKHREDTIISTETDGNSNVTIESGKDATIISTQPKKKDQNQQQEIGPILFVPEIKR